MSPPLPSTDPTEWALQHAERCMRLIRQVPEGCLSCWHVLVWLCLHPEAEELGLRELSRAVPVEILHDASPRITDPLDAVRRRLAPLRAMGLVRLRVGRKTTIELSTEARRYAGLGSLRREAAAAAWMRDLPGRLAVLLQRGGRAADLLWLEWWRRQPELEGRWLSSSDLAAVLPASLLGVMELSLPTLRYQLRAAVRAGLLETDGGAWGREGTAKVWHGKRYRTSNVERRTLNAELRTLNAERRTLNAELQTAEVLPND